MDTPEGQHHSVLDAQRSARTDPQQIRRNMEFAAEGGEGSTPVNALASATTCSGESPRTSRVSDRSDPGDSNDGSRR